MPKSERFTTISEPGAAITVTQMNLTDEEREALTVNVDLTRVFDCPFCSRGRYCEQNEKLKAAKETT